MAICFVSNQFSISPEKMTVRISCDVEPVYSKTAEDGMPHVENKNMALIGVFS